MSETPTRTALRPTVSDRLQAWLPRLVLAPSVAVSLFFVYGFMPWTFVLSLSHLHIRETKLILMTTWCSICIYNAETIAHCNFGG